ASALSVTLSRSEFYNKYDLDPSRRLVALLPGSRHSEIEHHLPLVLDAASRLARAETGVSCNESEALNNAPQFVLALASTIDRSTIQPRIDALSSKNGPRIAIAEDDTYNALSYSDIAVVASGTATVEAAIAGVPMVIIYRASELNWRLIRPLIHLDTFGMVNLIAGSRIVPELMQSEATGENIAPEVNESLSSPQRPGSSRMGLADVGRRWCEGGSGSEGAARAVMRAAAELDLGIVAPGL